MERCYSRIYRLYFSGCRSAGLWRIVEHDLGVWNELGEDDE
jgi:hypothetical protein